MKRIPRIWAAVLATALLCCGCAADEKPVPEREEPIQQTLRMIRDTQSCSGIPLFIGVDEEGGRVARVGRNPAMGTTLLPPMKQIGDTRDPMKALEVAKTLAEDLDCP